MNANRLPDQSRRPAECDFLIKNAYLITMDAERRIYRDGAVAITDGAIVRVGRSSDVFCAVEPKRTIDAQGGVVHPGFVDTHTHVSVHTTRGAFPDTLSFSEGMVFYTSWWNALKDEDEHDASLLACVEMVRNGTTCFLEAGSVIEPDAAAAAAEAVGVRGLLGDPFLADVSGPDAPFVRRARPDHQRAINALGGQLRRNTGPDALVRGHVALIGMGSASDELERAAKDCADQHGAVLNQHQSFMLSDVEADDRRLGKPAFAHFDEMGLLDDNCVFVHVNVLRDEEVQSLVRSGSSVTWCPSSSMIWGAGGTFHGRHAELLQAGVNVALGSDSANSAGRFDLGRQGFLAVLSARDKLRARDAMAAEDALELLTVRGARAVGLEDLIGSLEVGKRADLVVRSSAVSESQPISSPIQSLVFSSDARSIRLVIINGIVVAEDGHSTRVDEQAVYAAASASAKRVLERTGLHYSSRWPLIE